MHRGAIRMAVPTMRRSQAADERTAWLVGSSSAGGETMTAESRPRECDHHWFVTSWGRRICTLCYKEEAPGEWKEGDAS